jgi:2-polyprenyl-3-methyl-5-hydroxy-6-metoxy-1,4-benzoquinol methylase
MAHITQYIPILGAVEDEILACFREGGGVPYSSFPRFHEVMAEDSGQSVLGALMDHILPLVPGLKTSLVNGIRVLDCGCGRGMALMLMARHFPRSEFVGYDLSREAIHWRATKQRGRACTTCASRFAT